MIQQSPCILRRDELPRHENATKRRIINQKKAYEELLNFQIRLTSQPFDYSTVLGIALIPCRSQQQTGQLLSLNALGPLRERDADIACKLAPKDGETSTRTFGELSCLTFINSSLLQCLPKIVNAHWFNFNDSRTLSLSECCEPKDMMSLPFSFCDKFW